MDHRYHLEGQVSIPAERKAEFNENVLNILRVCGIRKRKEMEIAGKHVTVVREPEADKDGMVAFDYSIFEQQKRQVSFYDMNTCELHVTERGYREFGLVINLIMTMQEAYSVKHCYLMNKDQVCDVYWYAVLIERTIGLKLAFPNREKMWDMFLFFKTSGKYETMPWEELWDTLPRGYADDNWKQIIGCIISDQSAYRPEKRFECGKSELQQANTVQRTCYAYQLLQKLIKEKGLKEIEDFLRIVLEKDLTEREKLASREDDFGLLAAISLYDLPMCIVAAFGWAIGEEFWNTWFSLGITGYKDIYTEAENPLKEEKEKKTEGTRMLYRVFEREDEDEFLEFWDENELYLSENMKDCLEEWKENYADTDKEEAEAIDVEAYLADILQEMEQIWNCRYMDEKTVREFIEQGNELSYKKAVLVMRKMMDRLNGYFPELTVGQVKEWVLQRWIDCWERTKISAYGSLLGNHRKRMLFLGF